jgi:hypothetical protein
MTDKQAAILAGRFIVFLKTGTVPDGSMLQVCGCSVLSSSPAIEDRTS